MAERRDSVSLGSDLRTLIGEIYESTKNVTGGKTADYIPQLAEVNPELFGVAFCDLNGNISAFGDIDYAFCLQSCVKPLNYCLCRMAELVDEKAPTVHNHVGFEPSGVAFNAFVLNRQGLPHNPLINSGAIMTAAMIAAREEPAKRFNHVHKFISRLAGNPSAIGFDNGVFLSEKVHADRNISLAYYMRENHAFPHTPTQSEIGEHLDLYFQTCSLTANCKSMAAIAATLANHGTSPVSGDDVVHPDIVMDALSIMYACGMYDFSGQFAFNIGLPAKSGVSGALMLVLPNVGGICVWSPRLDELGNSVRGLEFCKEFTLRTNARYHIFRSIQRDNDDTQGVSNIKSSDTLTYRIIHACSVNDIQHLNDLLMHGRDQFRLGDEPSEVTVARLVNTGDYDKRTPLHLAASEGHSDLVQYLIDHGANPNSKDRWGNTPIHEVRKALKDTEDSSSKHIGDNPLKDRYMFILNMISGAACEEIDVVDEGNRSRSSSIGSHTSDQNKTKYTRGGSNMVRSTSKDDIQHYQQQYGTPKNFKATLEDAPISATAKAVPVETKVEAKPTTLTNGTLFRKTPVMTPDANQTGSSQKQWGQ